MGANKKVEGHLIKDFESDSLLVEAYRILRTNILLADKEQTLQTIQVTSASPGEGKSMVAANLASIIALAGSRCILVDANLRKPVLADQFGVNGQIGLTNVLMGLVKLESALAYTEIPGLRLLPGGPIPPNPADLLGSQAMAVLMEELKDQAALVIIDSPPLLSVVDSSLIAPLVDGVILVVGSGQTERKSLVRARQLLDAAQAKVLGVVLNSVSALDNGYQHYYSSYSDSLKGDVGA